MAGPEVHEDRAKSDPVGLAQVAVHRRPGHSDHEPAADCTGSLRVAPIFRWLRGRGTMNFGQMGAWFVEGTLFGGW